MSPFKSIKGRALGKLLEGYKSSDIGKGFGSGGGGGGAYFSSGGTKTQPGDGYVYHTFNSPGSYTFETTGGPGVKVIEVELLGGGGGGSSGWQAWAGGGGGGGYAHFQKALVNGSYPVTIGAGGARNSNCGSGGGVPNGSPGYNGADSTAFDAVASGGSAGANSGTSGGGGGGYTIPGSAGTPLPGSGNGQNGNNSSNDGSGWGGENGKRNTTPSWTTWGDGASGVPNGSPGPNASGYGNGGAGGHSCQGGHNGGGAGSGGIIVIRYAE